VGGILDEKFFWFFWFPNSVWEPGTPFGNQKAKERSPRSEVKSDF
jgi:hypothetical protein